MYGKINQVGQLITNPNRITIGDKQIINPTEADLIAAGYLPVEFAENMPMSDTAQPVYTEQNGKIVQSWKQVKTESKT